MGSAFIQESLPKGNPVGDDDKIYFFFSEAGKEFDFFDNTIVSRIARVCKVSDALGQIVHLNRRAFSSPPPPPPTTTTLEQLPHRHPSLCESDGPSCALCASAFAMCAAWQTQRVIMCVRQRRER